MVALRITYISCVEIGWNILKFLIDNKVCNVSLSGEQAIKYNVSGYKDHSDIAKSNSIQIYYPQDYKLSDSSDHEAIRSMKPDLILVMGWNRLIPKEVLAIPPLGCLGLHGSSEHLPRGRGRSPVNWSIIEGKKKFLLHLFYLDEGIDSGDIIGWLECEITQYDTCKTLYTKLSILAKRLLAKYLPLIEKGSAPRIQQDSSKATYYAKRTPEDGLINWNDHAERIFNLIRGITRPYPGAFTYLNGKRFIIWEAIPYDSIIKYEDAKAGEVVEVFDDIGIVVKAADSLLLITDFEIESEKIDRYPSVISLGIIFSSIK